MSRLSCLFRTPAAAVTAAALTTGPVLLMAAPAPAHADGAEGGELPDGGGAVNLARAEVATAEATVDAHGAEASSNLARAEVHVPGLPGLSLVKVDQVTSKAVCAVGEKPAAESRTLGSVSVLGRRVTVTVGGEPTTVTVPGVGEVSLGFSQTETTWAAASAVALRLRVSVNPLKLNVAAVKGEVTLVEAACETPSGGGTDTPADPGERPQGDAEPVEDARPADAADPAPAGRLAETGGSSATPYLVGGAALLVGTGLGGVVLARMRTRA